jgi:hypothetical protein
MYADPSQTQFKWFSVLDETNRCYKYDEADEVEELLFFYFVSQICTLIERSLSQCCIA